MHLLKHGSTRTSQGDLKTGYFPPETVPELQGKVIWREPLDRRPHSACAVVDAVAKAECRALDAGAAPSAVPSHQTGRGIATGAQKQNSLSIDMKYQNPSVGIRLIESDSVSNIPIVQKGEHSFLGTSRSREDPAHCGF